MENILLKEKKMRVFWIFLGHLAKQFWIFGEVFSGIILKIELYVSREKV